MNSPKYSDFQYTLCTLQCTLKAIQSLWKYWNFAVSSIALNK